MKNLPFQQDTESIVRENLKELQEIQENESLDNKVKQIKIRSKLEDISEGKWTIIEDALLDIEVECRTEVLLKKTEKIPPLTKRVEMMKKELSKKFKEEPEVLKVLLAAIPDMNNIRRWVKKKDWKEEIDRRMRDCELFSSENRHKMIRAIFDSGLKGSAKHAEMYLKMSGDLGKSTDSDPKQNIFSQMQEALKKK